MPINPASPAAFITAERFVALEERVSELELLFPRSEPPQIPLAPKVILYGAKWKCARCGATGDTAGNSWTHACTPADTAGDEAALETLASIDTSGHICAQDSTGKFIVGTPIAKICLSAIRADPGKFVPEYAQLHCEVEKWQQHWTDQVNAAVMASNERDRARQELAKVKEENIALAYRLSNEQTNRTEERTRLQAEANNARATIAAMLAVFDDEDLGTFGEVEDPVQAMRNVNDNFVHEFNGRINAQRRFADIRDMLTRALNLLAAVDTGAQRDVDGVNWYDARAAITAAGATISTAQEAGK